MFGRIAVALVALLALVFACGCSAEQLARDEAVAHGVLVRLEHAVDWANANPDVVVQVLDDAAKESDDAALQKAITKAKAAVTNGDLKKAQSVISFAAAITAP